eukprot:850065-Prorocentrum_minimum.AAC.1
MCRTNVRHLVYSAFRSSPVGSKPVGRAAPAGCARVPPPPPPPPPPGYPPSPLIARVHTCEGNNNKHVLQELIGRLYLRDFISYP